jgi:hypothetical protein
MSESVQFWLDNKMSAGIKMAAIGDQVLVVYREKYYVVEQGAAHMRGGKPIRFSKTSMPAIWKKALRGEVPPPEEIAQLSEEALPMATSTRKERVKPEVQQPQTPVHTEIQTPGPVKPPASSQPTIDIKPIRSVKKMDAKPVPQATVAANCPHCNHKHDLPLEKGKNGKPFFVACARCKADFAVRFVPATIFQAQVAGFR